MSAFDKSQDNLSFGYVIPIKIWFVHFATLISFEIFICNGKKESTCSEFQSLEKTIGYMDGTFSVTQ